jgi:flagellin
MSGAANGTLDTSNFGRLTLVTLSSKDIIVTDSQSYLNTNLNSAGSSANINLRDVRGNFLATQGVAAGAYANSAESGAASKYLGSGVTTRTGAMMVMDIAESAMKLLDKIRADLGSAQQQLVVTINNISVTQVSVLSAESQIRDVDFAEESANFSKRNILAQSGSFAMAQANTVQQNVLKLLQ